MNNIKEWNERSQLSDSGRCLVAYPAVLPSNTLSVANLHIRHEGGEVLHIGLVMALPKTLGLRNCRAC